MSLCRNAENNEGLHRTPKYGFGHLLSHPSGCDPFSLKALIDWCYDMVGDLAGCVLVCGSDDTPMYFDPRLVYSVASD